LDAVVNKIMALCRATDALSKTPEVEVAPDTIQEQLKQLRQQLAAKDEENKALRQQLLRLFPFPP